MKNTKKMVALLLALTLMLGCAIGGTVAYLIDQTSTIENTFTSSDVSIKLEEDGAENNKQSFQMVPGKEITKKATVTVNANSEKCYLFVKVEKSSNFDTYMTYSMNSGWTQLKDGNGNNVVGVFYREVVSSTENQPFEVLADNKVVVKNTLTKTDMESAKNADTYMKFTAYAIQFDHLENVSNAYGAWLLINPPAQG